MPKQLHIYYVYILLCSDNSYYVGFTNDIDRRFREHNNGKYKGFTYKRRPVQLIYHQKFNDIFKAKAFEKQLKGWSRAKKQALVDGNSIVTERLANL